jgi:GDP-4-dehydro-6-deoxy-D-mannose reductase
MQRILITGAGGFVGRHLIRHLRETLPNAQIIALVRSQPSAVSDQPSLLTTHDSRLATRSCDLLEGEGSALAAIVCESAPDAVFHLAARASVAAADRQTVLQTNIDGTRYLLEACAALPTPPRTLFVSTGYVYGACDPARPAQETDPMGEGGGVYAESKRTAEAVAREFGEFTLIARAFNHTGPGQSPNFAIPGFARQIARIERGEQLPQLRVGNLSAQRDFLDVRDVVRAYRLLIEQGKPGEVYNVASGKAHTMQSLLDRLLALSAVPTTVVEDPERMRPSDIPLSVGDPAKLIAATGWQPHIPFETTLQETLEAWRTPS